MRFKLRIDLSCQFDPAARAVNEILRLNPRNHEGQQVLDWGIECDVDSEINFYDDSAGNLTQSVSANGPVSLVTTTVSFLVDTYDTAGMVRGLVERFPEPLFLRSTARTAAGPGIGAFADKQRSGIKAGDGAFAALHALLPALCEVLDWNHELLSCDVASVRDAEAVFQSGAGNAAEIAQVFAACARRMGMPARVVSGCHFDESEAAVENGAMHAWSEVYAEGYGWIGFDAAVGICTAETHVRFAAGVDWPAAAPVRVGSVGFAAESTALHVSMKIA